MQLKRRLIASGVEMGPKESKFAEAFLLHRCSKEATLIPFPSMSVKFTCQTFSHKFGTLFESRAIPSDRHTPCFLNWVSGRGGGKRIAGHKELITGLVRLKVDVIVMSGSPRAWRAAQQATRTIPIVMAGIAADPVKAGFVVSLARPGSVPYCTPYWCWLLAR